MLRCGGSGRGCCSSRSRGSGRGSIRAMARSWGMDKSSVSVGISVWVVVG